MNIGIIELHYHEEFITTLCSLFEDADITIFTTLEIKSNLPKDVTNNTLFVLCEDNKKDFIANIPVHNFGKVFVNTIQPTISDFSIWKDYPISGNSILTLHNLNAWSNKSFVPRLNLAHTFDSFISSKYSDKILSKFGTINVVYEPMVEYAKSLFPYHKIIHIPFTLAQDNIVSTPHKTIDFVIPGTVTNNRRNYQELFETFDRIYEKNKTFRLILLGKPGNANIGIRPYVGSFDSRVSDIEYNEYLRNADFVICPSVKNTHTVNTATEFYGKTKASNLCDAIKWRKPIIIPDYISYPDGLLSSVLTYNNSSDLFPKIKRILSDQEYITCLKREAVKNCDWFSKEQVRKRLQGVL